MRCVKCGCTDEHACEGGCSWVSTDPPLCSRCNQATPVFSETIGGALIDSARISVMAAMQAFPEIAPKIILPGDENDPPTLNDCLEQAMHWLDAARLQTLEHAAAPTSLHVIGR